MNIAAQLVLEPPSEIPAILNRLKFCVFKIVDVLNLSAVFKLFSWYFGIKPVISCLNVRNLLLLSDC